MEGRTALEYYVLDVFSNESYKGNPLSVVFTDGNLRLETYKDISKEFGYSETSFVYYSTREKALVVRSFTPTGIEIDGAGHNLLGAVCGALLKGMPIFEEQNESEPFVIMKHSAIPVTVSFDPVTFYPVVQMHQKSAVIKQEIPTYKIAVALGLKIEDLDVSAFVPTVVKTEVAHTMVPIKNSQLLNSFVPDNQLLIEISKEYNFEGFYCFTIADEGQEHIVETRFFNPIIGINEDPATGTAAGPLIGFLTQKKFTKSEKEYKILQGVKLKQASMIEVMNREEDILVGGSSIITMKGELYI
ncbi:PhzF family phenazine biosynthesis protein [Flavobacterium johnsoniae]|jgi:PhzF family phenazine biosynthesis protein|uniref:Phenazine biosynthesis protein PhzF family n=1 Tax=Flavobacterium johnsoniae (strain ATCC 17061 / DSM 2064 / JCM 8514 / BCRC 14874 / CCUG 350202 / NBRC 14942 / NCIMB 11054 / UW101) TaxID=376686 RepID=A5FLM5_FLAJ1|nr:PhzF family phenazine biosynthesis protein [Flavobacterium johnsoniae]ABQ03889.1 phenazine biosynthesis protein PhzF family [Flavobacterium johnsoniae UW101]OXE96241.1 phenazine biosynthesis protein PhzF [Flavobacterium johnsoniae UW101]WQG79246.1 PhzF family phenazine biosynthesis protein [Flavobacterium johnsoniae UW101]SHK05706.1 phenazine biosynthesis protein PhzF family [Flavobacterium johnsoniae]